MSDPPTSLPDPPDRSPDPDAPPRLPPLHVYRALLRGHLVETRLRSLSPGWLRSPRAIPGPSSRLVSVVATLSMRRASDGAGDVIAPEPFDPGPALILGISPVALFREALGRSSAPAGGRTGPGGWSDLSLGLLGPVATPAAMVEVMAGVTLAERMKGSRRVGLVISPPGASATGAWHEGLNFAAVRKCPLVLVVLTPPPSDGAPTSQLLVTRVDRPIDRARGYGISAHLASASELSELHRTVARALEAARQGAGVQLVEVTSPHPLSPPTDGAESEDLPGPLARLRGWIQKEGLGSDSQLTGVESELRRQVVEAWDRASSEPRASPPRRRRFGPAGVPPSPALGGVP